MKDDAPPGRRRMRRLSDEEITLWLMVTKSVTPRPDATLPTPASPAPEPAAETAPIPPAPQIPPKPAPAATLPGLAPLDRRLRQRLTRGRTDVDAVIDLHGLTQQEAHGALHRFLCPRASQWRETRARRHRQRRKPRAENYGGAGVLRRNVPLWLRAPDWRGLVVGFEEASRPHGGAGALYVRLRRRDRPDR